MVRLWSAFSGPLRIRQGSAMRYCPVLKRAPLLGRSAISTRTNARSKTRDSMQTQGRRSPASPGKETAYIKARNEKRLWREMEAEVSYGGRPSGLPGDVRREERRRQLAWYFVRAVWRSLQYMFWIGIDVILVRSLNTPIETRFRMQCLQSADSGFAVTDLY